MADFIGGLVSAGINYGFSQDQFNKQRYLQHDAQRYNSLMFDTANAYNSPLSQMMRFKQAGLNPNLIYGQMVNGSPSPTSGIGSAGQAQSQPMSMLETAQIGLIDAQKENIEADTANKEEQNVLMQSQEKLNDSMAALNESQKKEVEANIPLIQTQVKKTFQEYRKLKVDSDRANEFYDAQIRKLQADANLSDVEASDIINTFKDRVNLLIAQANRENWTSKELEDQCEILGEEYVQATYATKVAEATSSVEGSKGYQWTSSVLGLVSEAVGTVGSVMLGFGALKGAGAAASRASVESQRIKLFEENSRKGSTTGFRPKY